MELVRFPSSDGDETGNGQNAENRPSESASGPALEPIVGNLPCIVYQRHLSADGRISFPYISEGVRDVWGFSPEEVMADPGLLLQAIKANSRDDYEAATAESARSLTPWQVDVEVTTREGESRWVRGIAHPRRADDGGTLWDGVIFDITPEKEFEARLAERDNRLAQAKTLASLGYFSFDADSAEVWWSDETYDIYGVGADAFSRTESGLLELIHPDDRLRVAQARRRCLDAREAWDMEYRVCRRDGTERVLHSIAEPVVENDRVTGFTGTVQDVTERAEDRAALKLRESEAREAERLLTDVVENVTDGFAVFDADDRLVLFNQAYPHMFPHISEQIREGARFTDLVEAASRAGQFAGHREDAGEFVQWRLAKRDAGEPFAIQLDNGRWIEVHDRKLPDGMWVNTRVDITEERNAERALRDSEARLAYAQRIASIGNFEREIESGHVTWSANQYVIFGVDPETFDHTHESVRSFIVEDDLPAFLEANRRAIEYGEPWDLHFRITRRDGVERVIHSVGEAVFEEGRATRIRGVMQDVTEARENEEALRHSLDRFDLVTRATRDGVFDWSIKSGTCWFSANSRAIFGYDQADQEGSIEEWRVRIHPSDRSMISRAIDDLFVNGKPYNVEYRFLRADGVWRWFQSVGMVQRDANGELVRMVGSNRDVTERRQADERFRVLFERSTDPHLLMDQNGIIDCNNATLEMLMCEDRAQLVGQHLSDLSPANQPDGRISFEKAQGMDALARARGFHRYEWSHQRFDGREFLVETTMSPVALDSGPALLVVWHDIEARKRAEEALREAKDAAEHANKAKSDFLASMSHEIRTPLNGVIGMLGLLLRGALNDTQRDQAEVARQSAESLLSLINDILDVSKLEAGRIDIERIDFNLLEVVSGVTELLHPKARECGNRIDVNFDPEVPVEVESDPTKLRQVLFNLVGNAAKFTENGTVTVNVRCLENTGEEAQVRFEVVDTGIGISPDVRDQLFEKFSQGDASISRRYGGTGLGLSICRMLVEALGGEIDVESELGEGSTFWFEIPVSVAQPAAQDNDGADVDDDMVQDDTLAGFRILLAEDNPINQQIAVSLLCDAGAEVKAVMNGLEAVAQVQADTYDVVLMDIRMPELDGVEAAKRVRALGGRYAELPIIAMTANAMRGDRDTYLDAGMNDYVSKPLSFGKLFRTILKWAQASDPEPVAAATGSTGSAADESPELDSGDAPEEDVTSGRSDLENDVIDGLETALGRERVRDLVGLQVKTARDLMDRLQEGMASGDDDMTTGAAHDLKSTFGQFGALRASDVAATIETAMRDGRRDEARDALEACLELAERATRALETRYARDDAA